MYFPYSLTDLLIGAITPPPSSSDDNNYLPTFLLIILFVIICIVIIASVIHSSKKNTTSTDNLPSINCQPNVIVVDKNKKTYGYYFSEEELQSILKLLDDMKNDKSS